MNVVPLASNQITADRPHSHFLIAVSSLPDQSNIGSVRTVGGLNRVTANRSFTDGARAGIEVNLGCWFGICIRHFVCSIVVVFDIVACDLQISNFTSFDTDPTEPTVADVRTADNCLMKIDSIQKYANAKVMINVAMTDQYVSGSPGNMN